MSNAPNMLPEVVEAIHLMFEDYPDIETDCMLYLKSIANDTGAISDWFDEHQRCFTCGSALTTYAYKEPHFEFSPVEYEDMTETVCPVCGLGGDRYY